MPTKIVQLSDTLAVTNHVENRLRKSATTEVPKNPGYFVPVIASVLTLLLVCSLGIFYALSNLPKPNIGGLWWIVGIAWLYLAYKAADLVETMFAGLRNSWDTKVNLRVLETANERDQRIQERESFYSSPEWKLLRDRVIQEEGRRCRDCGRTIRQDIDVTVDHILPRSKYPHLALQRDNLRVLCRSCNSAKGASGI